MTAPGPTPTRPPRPRPSSRRPRAPRPAGRRPGARAVGWAGALLAALAACGPSGEEVGRGVLLVTIDGLRFDHLSAAGYDRETTPTLDALADGGVLFTQTFAAAPWLVPAHLALLAGCDPNLGWRSLPEGLQADVERRWRLPRAVSTLGVELLASGYRTAAFSDHTRLSPVLGFGRGFQEFRFSDFEGGFGPRGSGTPGLVPEVLRWVRGLDDDEPWFVYLHLNDLLRAWEHRDAQWDTYFEPRAELDSVPPVASAGPALFAIPPERWSGGTDTLGDYEARYDGALRRLDEHLRRLLDGLRGLGRLESTTICVVGTHGFQFGEAGLILDAGRLSVADLHVPWILRPAEGSPFPRGERVRSLASTVDVMPTLLELEGLAVPGSVQGLSQLPALGPDGTSVRELAFASCGIQFGMAAIGRRFVLEWTFPSIAVNRGLVEAWYGDEAEHGNDSFFRLYDRREEPHPPLWRTRSSDEVGGHRLNQAMREWFPAVETVRAEIQREASSVTAGADSLRLLSELAARLARARSAPDGAPVEASAAEGGP